MLSRLAACLVLAGCTDYGFADVGHEDPGETAEVDDCADFAPTAPTDPTVDEACVAQVEEEPGTWTPHVEWEWREHPTHSGYHQIMSTPAIGNLTDDDGDGDIDADDIPDIVFSTFTGSAYTSAGVLTAISGDGGELVWAVSEVEGHQFYSSSGVAIGDLEGDGSPDVCVAGVSAAVVCLEADGSLKWAAGTETYGYGAPSIADMDGDGTAEVTFGRQIFDAQGNLVGLGAYGVGRAYMSVPADLDGDGMMELIAGNAIYKMDGSTLVYDGGTDGIPAIGDFDLDGIPEIVRTTGSTVLLMTMEGHTIWEVAVPGGGGGPPTIADFDGDGLPEVGVAGLSYYTMFDTSGAVVWSNLTEDDSSSVTGSSVFDFDNDGASEVVYADEHNLFVYDGASGTVRLQLTEHASGTLYEYPLVADVDNDGSTEIIVASNNYAWSGWNGITVIGDADDSWAPARPIWNQGAYHITNVDDDGGIPREAEQNWLTWNNFRAGGTPDGPGHWLADVGPGDSQACLDTCAGDQVTLYLPIANEGLSDAESFAVVLQAEDGTVVHEAVVTSLVSGDSALLGPITLDLATWGAGSLVARVDVTGAVEECDEGDNTVAIGGWPCP